MHEQTIPSDRKLQSSYKPLQLALQPTSSYQVQEVMTGLNIQPKEVDRTRADETKCILQSVKGKKISAEFA